MRQMLKGLILACVFLACTTGSALASVMDFGYFGAFNIIDTDTNGISETLTFYDVKVDSTTPSGDAIFGATINIQDMTFDESNPYAFSPTTYNFEVEDFFSAKLSVVEMDVFNNAVGGINSSLKLNLADIVMSNSYVIGSSAIAEAFFAGDRVGSTGMTLIKTNLFTAIDSGDITRGTFAGTATPAPEPATMLLFSTGIAGLVGIGRKRKGKGQA